MLRSVNEMMGYILSAMDGDIGRCRDLLFDDVHWTIRYMVADTGKWLPGRKVLISPISMEEPEWQNRRFPVNLNKKQIENSPPLDEHAPVSRQYELKYSDYYSSPYYWSGEYAWGIGPYPHPPVAPLPPIPTERQDIDLKDDQDPEKSHLRSIKEVTGYHIDAVDGEIGHVDDFIVQDNAWSIRYLVVDTRNWLPGRKVLISPMWIDSLDWSERKVQVTLTVNAIKGSPEYNPAQPVNREYEARLYDYYGRPVYWKDNWY